MSVPKSRILDLVKVRKSLLREMVYDTQANLV